MVSEATRATGYLEGLFEGPMLDSKGIKDKESKIKYLTTLIDCVGNSLGRPIDVNPKKIVAGHEPEKTNALLQALYEAATADPGAGDPNEPSYEWPALPSFDSNFMIFSLDSATPSCGLSFRLAEALEEQGFTNVAW